MLLEQRQRCRTLPVGRGGVCSGTSWAYNEVIIDIQGLATHYPRGVEAFVLDVGNIDEDCTHTKVRGRNLWRSFNDQHVWNATYGFEIPVLEMDLAAADPFRVPENVPEMTFG